MLKNHWFYRPSNQTCEYNIGFIDPATEIVEQPLVLLENQSQQRPATGQAPDPGSGFETLAWIHYEEPLQPSCLGKIK